MAKVTYGRDGAIGRVTLRRPELMNALSSGLMADLFDALRDANADNETRVVVVSGEGEHFCAGGDLEWEGELDERSALDLMRLTGHLSYELRNAPKPVMGCIRGYCLGGGNELNLHFDVSIASETAKFAQPETRWGLLPFWNTPQLLPLVVGERRAREMLMFGRMYDADEALEMGLCNAVVPDDQLESTVDEWADELIQRSPTALRLVKVAMNSVTDQLRGASNHEAALVAATVGSARYREEVAHFFAMPGSRRPKAAPTRHMR
jgi:naphthoate synthase/2-ketocyclohexanecarboxyl-CoA hydrolase